MATMNRLLPSLLLAALSLAAFVACSDSDPGTEPSPTPTSESPAPAPTETPSPEPTDEPSPTPTAEPTGSPTAEPFPGDVGHPRGTRTGAPGIDAFLDAFEDGDVDSVGEFLLYRPVPCVAPQTAEYAVACPEGVEEGTPVLAFVHSGCHGTWASEQMRETFAKSLTEMPIAIHSVYSTPDHTHPTEIDPPDRDIAALMVNSQQGWYSVFWFNDAGDITDISLGCGHDLPNAISVWGLKGAPVLFAAP